MKKKFQYLEIQKLLKEKKFLEAKNLCLNLVANDNDSVAHNYLGLISLNFENYNESEKFFEKSLETADQPFKISIKKNLIISKFFNNKFFECENIIKKNIGKLIHDIKIIELLVKCSFYTKNSFDYEVINVLKKILIINAQNYNFINTVLNNLIFFQFEDIVLEYLNILSKDDQNHLDSYQNSILAIFYYKINKFLISENYLKKPINAVHADLKISMLAEIQRYKNNKISAYKNYMNYFKNTNDPGALLSVAGMFKFKKKNYKTFNIINNFDVKKRDREGQYKFFYTLSKVKEDLKNFSDSQNYFTLANQLRNQTVNFNWDLLADELVFYRQKFNKSFYEKYSKFGKKNIKPIFILGLPRSGSTLVEQILGSHSNIKNYGELKIFNSNLKYFFNIHKKIELEKDIDQLDSNKINHIGNLYFEKIKKFTESNHAVFTDKMPFNFYFIGLIKTVLPNSKIIVTKRSLKDNFLSILKNYFYDDLLNFAYSEENIIKYFNLYVDHINYYKNIFANNLFALDYEELINNPDKIVKNLLIYCEEDWEDQCLEFYKNKNIITTLSANQARNKIYKSSSNLFKKYKLENSFKQLDKIIEKVNF